MRPFAVDLRGYGLFLSVASCALLIPRPSYAALSAIDAQAPAAEPEAPAAPAKAEPAAQVEPVLAKPSASPSEDYKATKKIPPRLLRPLLGCWQLGVQERWTISRLDASGAQVVTNMIKGSKKRAEAVPFPDYARRAAVPATLMYDTRQDNFGFASAGRSHPTLVVFKKSGPILEASLFSKRSHKAPYTFTGNSATLDRCKAVRRAHAKGAPPAVPPRLK
jgi:hypothetical protein